MGHKIHIVGGAGSGKTYVSKILSDKLNVECYDLDDIFWDNSADTFGIKALESVRDAKLEEILNKDSWIIEGVYYEWGRRSFEKADRIFLLKPNTYLQHWRVIVRFIKRKLGLEEVKKKETLRSLIDMIKWNHVYNSKICSEILNYIDGCEDKVTIITDGKEILKLFERGS